MNVRCENCKKTFEIPVQIAGKIEYARCANVFRVTYKFRTPCAHCRTILKLRPDGREKAVGVPVPVSTEEKTENIFAFANEATVPRTLAGTAGVAAVPTIRVNFTKPSPSRRESFRLIEKPRKRPTPVHVALRPKSRASIPVMKILWVTLIALGMSTTIGLTFLAFQSHKADKADPPTTPQQGNPAAQSKSAPDVVRNDTGFQGGPQAEESALPASDDTVSATEENLIANYKFPRIDRLTSSYGTRKDPFHGRLAFHGGIDIAGEERSEVRVALDGKVTFVGTKGGYGKIIVVKHGDGYETVYGHLAKALIKKGSNVKQGDLIGLVGSSGRSTGPHLHFEMRKDGKTIDPLRAKLMAKRS